MEKHNNEINTLKRILWQERTLFFIVLAVNLSYVFSMKFFPSLDGPAHLHNSKVLFDLFKGSQAVLNEFFSINAFYLPNWFSHIMLGALGSIMPAWLAEKIFLAGYLVGIAYSFRLLVKQLSPDNLHLTVLIFPFAYTHLFCIGFYNYSFSFIFLFLTLYYWLKTKGNRRLKELVILSVWITLTYFSGILTYGFLGIILGVTICINQVKEFVGVRDAKRSLIALGKELGILFLISLPSLLMMAAFFYQADFLPAGKGYSGSELLNWLNDGRILIAYVFSWEVIYTRSIVHIILIIIAFDLFFRYKDFRKGDRSSIYRPADILLIPILVSIILYFAVPDDSGARMMTWRFLALFYLLLIVWIASARLEKGPSKVLALLIVLLHFGLLANHNKAIKGGIAEHAKAINLASSYIEKGSVVLPVNLSDNWLELHFASYLGVDKPLVILENYETDVGWFPVQWKDSLPDLRLGDQSTLKHLNWKRTATTQEKRPIDFVFVYGNLSQLKEKKWDDLNEILIQHYQVVSSSDKNYFVVYRSNLKRVNSDRLQ